MVSIRPGGGGCQSWKLSYGTPHRGVDSTFQNGDIYE
jgi:hypothetical protein